jgi:hypothetical protein
MEGMRYGQPATNTPDLQRRQLLELIEEEQAKAWRKFLDSGVPEAHGLAAMGRIRAYALFALNEYDQLYLAFEEMVEREGRSPAHQQYITDKVGFLLRSLEASIAELLALTIRQPIEAARQPPPQAVITPPVYNQPSPPAWQTVLFTTVKLLIWLIGLPASLLLAFQFTGSDVWAWSGPLLLCALWLLCRFSWLGLLFPLCALGAALLL